MFCFRRSSSQTLGLKKVPKSYYSPLLTYSMNFGVNTDKDKLKIQEGKVSHHNNEYFKSFMKLLKAQREVPFIYSPKDFNVEKLKFPFLRDIKHTDGTFADFELRGDLIEKLSEQGISSPLPIQTASLPKLLQGKKSILISSTGTGKTLCYLLPILQNIGKNSCANIIIVPTRELASQVYKEAMTYVTDKALVSRHVSGINEEHEKKLIHALKDSKLLIGTPKKLLEIVETHTGFFRKVKCIVADEVDKLLPYSYRNSKHSKMRLSKPKPTEKLLSILTHYQNGAQLIATSATISRSLVQELQDLGFGKHCVLINHIPIEFPNGKVPENIRHNYSISQENETFSKINHVSRLFRCSREKSALVFIHRSESVENVVEQLKDIGLSASALYKELLLPAPGSFQNFLNTFKAGDTQLVVATEETVRGMDFPFVNMVYVTYLPETPENYVHVAGRVGRLNRSGTIVTVFGKCNERSDKRKLKKIFSALSIKGKLLKF